MRGSQSTTTQPLQEQPNPTMKHLRLVAILASLTLVGSAMAGFDPSRQQEADDNAASQRAVLVTGASTGIGRKTTEMLAQRGFFVYAGARKQKDLDALNALENVRALRLDVTIPAEIDAAVETVRAGGRGLYGLINNAGVAVAAPLIEVTEEDLKFQLDVNVFGPYRITKAFAPMIIESKGRISTTGSISGFLTWGLGGPYTMSKHAIEAYTDVLAAEMARFGVEVSVVDPGNYRSRISASMRQRMIDKGYTGEGSRYENQIQWLMKAPADRTQYKEPDEVAEAFYHFLTDPEPKQRYMVVPNRREAEQTLRSTIKRVVQLNQTQAYSYDREGLIELLDEALEAVGE
jgi:NAD(P)-dependent dehydrogenase (short-subunit alcohol dehydrogenase family)